MAPSGERILRKGSHGVFAGKTVCSMPECFEIYIVYKRRHINTLPFLSFPLNTDLNGGYDQQLSDDHQKFMTLIGELS